MLTYSRCNSFSTICFCVLVGTWLAVQVAQADKTFQDPLDVPAKKSTKITARPLLDITHAGDFLVAVGSRGMIIYSQDKGKSWTQSAVPVQSDLLAVQFPTPNQGWAVGHDGVILQSTDGGKTWSKQLDGRIAAGIFKKYYMNLHSAPDIKAAARLIELNYKPGPSLPWLDVWFEDAQKGFVVGSFGMIAATVDGGKTWEPWLHRIDNDKGVNLNSVGGVGGNIFIAGERGTVFKLDRENGRFHRTETGYAGSLFGIMGNTHILLAYGLRGVVYRSEDSGATWEAMRLETEVTVTAGVKHDSAGFLLVNSAGQILSSDALGRSFSTISLGTGMRNTGIVLTDPQGAEAVVTGMGGVKTQIITGAAN